MEYTLLIGDRSYSSWSLRGWLPFAAFDIPVRVQSNILYRAAFADDLAAFAPGLRSVPALKTPQGGLLTDSIAIAWHLAEAFPDRGLLPLEPAQRAMAQSLIAEMHSGFGALRSACPKPAGPQNQTEADFQSGTRSRSRSPVRKPSRSSTRI